MSRRTPPPLEAFIVAIVVVALIINAYHQLDRALTLPSTFCEEHCND